MTRTRYVAGAAVLALVAVPFIGASPASAAAAAAVTGPLQTGDTELIDLTAPDEAGAYTVELWQTAKVATIATGTDATAIADINWTIPTGVAAYVGADFKIKVVPGDGAAFTGFESGTFAIEKSNVNTIAGQGTTWAAGVTKELTWENSGPTGDLVDIAIVSSAGKATVLKKKTANDGEEDVTLPVKTAAAEGYTVKITPSNKAAAAGVSAAVEVEEAAAPSVAVADDSIEKGTNLTVTPTSTSGNVKLVLVLKSAPTKVLATLSKSAPTGDAVTVAWPAKLAAGTYQVIASVVGTKPAVTGTSADIVVSDFAVPVLDEDTTDALAADVTQGQTVTVTWTSPGAGTYDVSVTLDGKATKIATKVAVAAGGTKSVSWTTSTKTKVGDAYTLTVANSVAPTVKATSSAFEVVANTTTLA